MSKVDKLMKKYRMGTDEAHIYMYLRHIALTYLTHFREVEVLAYSNNPKELSLIHI